MKTSNTPKIHLIAICILVSFIFLYPVQTTKVSNCGKADDNYPTVFEDPTTRNLQGFINPHGFRIKFLDPPSTVSFNLTEVKNMYAIAATFFKQLIKVTDVADSTRYTLSYNCGTITPNSIYATAGFNFGQADMVISTSVYSNSSDPSSSYYDVRLVRSWPQYAYIEINLYYFSFNPSNTYRFQQNLLLFLHVNTHILGFADFAYQNYKVSYLSSTKIPLCQVITSYNGKKFITTPNVKDWVQRHYGCDQSSIGGLLEDQNGAYNHWQKITTYDDYMNNNIDHGSKITPLSLLLLKDTGYYYDIDLSLADTIQFGKNRGCNFARGLVNSNQANPQFCTSNTTQDGKNYWPLNFYYNYGGFCGSSNDFSNHTLIKPYTNFICSDRPAQNLIFSSLNVFGAFSKAFQAESTQYQGPHCFISKCVNNNIEVTVNGITATCFREGSKTIVVSGTKVFCPYNFDAFCSRQNCPNFCGSQGLCLKGSCLSNSLCSSIDSNCIRCKGSKCTGCNAGLYPTKYGNIACNTCQNILPHCNNGCQVTQDGITICKKAIPIQPILGYCPTCVAILYCNTCTNSTNGTNCLTCSSNSNGKPRYPTFDRQSCKLCSQIISNCTACNVNSGSTTCIACQQYLTPNMLKNKCIIPLQLIGEVSQWAPDIQNAISSSIFADASMVQFDLPEAPRVITSLNVGSSTQDIIGATSIYSLSTDHFRVYLSGTSTNLTVINAADNDFKLMYMVADTNLPIINGQESTWHPYITNGIYADINLSNYSLANRPYIFTALDGDSSHWKMIGMNSIYDLTSNGFRVYLSSTTTTLSTDIALQRNLKLLYMAIPRPIPAQLIESHIFGQNKNWQYNGNNSIFVDVDLSMYNLNTAPYVFTSLNGNYLHWKMIGMNNICSLTATGFRVYLSGIQENLTVSKAIQRNFELMYMIVPKSETF